MDDKQKLGEEPTEQKEQQITTEEQNNAAISLKFIDSVERQMKAELGEELPWTPLQKVLAQHMFIKVDQTLKALEIKRLGDKDDKDGAAYCWANVNMYKFSIDTVHRVNLELDALIPNHIHPIPYWNKKLQKFDIDLRVGYEGKFYCHQKMCIDPPLEVLCKLVHKNEKFVPHFKDKENEFDSYTLTASENPFDIGDPVGGFGYIAFDDPRKNILIVVSPNDFSESKGYAQTKTFWDKHAAKMMLKTVVHRTMSKLKLDPTKVNPISWLAVVESRDDAMIAEFEEDLEANANGEMLSLEANAESVIAAPGFIEQSQAAPTPVAVSTEKPKSEEEITGF